MKNVEPCFCVFSVFSNKKRTVEESRKGKKSKYNTVQEKIDAKRVKEANKGLKAGWKAFVDTKGNLYYGNAATGSASWTRP
eukprot:NODE_3855_length_722_cov_54.251114_g2946_i1.p1 GENE.NODE_3855_length_722_cov_54.251114_g2946_i1~~NODE_3855_length_722_cov_54.251114_g2946_i1.p1  ORF type:complete len:81 (+),score=17.59 NODE_3855_length_722_cov_54.251114_g2946_i1:420-662(+)